MRLAITTLSSSAGVVLVALVLATPVEAADCEGRGAAAVACEVNRVRSGHGLKGLETDRRLRRAAAAYAGDMVEHSYFSHVSPEGGTLSERLRAVGYINDPVRWRVGETLAWGRGRSSTPVSIVAAWMRSPPHRRVVLGPYLEVGVGIARGTPFGGRGVTYAADFGRLG